MTHVWRTRHAHTPLLQQKRLSGVHAGTNAMAYVFLLKYGKLQADNCSAHDECLAGASLTGNSDALEKMWKEKLLSKLSKDRKAAKPSDYRIVHEYSANGGKPHPVRQDQHQYYLHRSHAPFDISQPRKWATSQQIFFDSQRASAE